MESNLTTTDYCYILNPKAVTQLTKIPSRDFILVGLGAVEKVLPNNKPIVRRLGTKKTQILNRIRLRKSTPSATLVDRFVRKTDWQNDENVTVTHDDWYAHTWNTNFGTNPFNIEPRDHNQDDVLECVPITHTPTFENSKNSGRHPVEQVTVPNEELPSDNADNEIDRNEEQLDEQRSPIMDAEKPPEITDENQITLSEENDEV